VVSKGWKCNGPCEATKGVFSSSRKRHAGHAARTLRPGAVQDHHIRRSRIAAVITTCPLNKLYVELVANREAFHTAHEQKKSAAGAHTYTGLRPKDHLAPDRDTESQAWEPGRIRAIPCFADVIRCIASPAAVSIPSNSKAPKTTEHRDPLEVEIERPTKTVLPDGAGRLSPPPSAAQTLRRLTNRQAAA